MASPAGVPKRSNSGIVQWLTSQGVAKKDAQAVADQGDWRKFKDPSLLVEYLGSRIAVYQQNQAGEQAHAGQQKDQAETSDAQRRLAAEVLLHDHYLTAPPKDDTEFAVALANWQRDNKVNAGNALLDEDTITAVRDHLLSTTPPESRDQQWQALVQGAKKDNASNVPVAAPTPAAPVGPPPATQTAPAAPTHAPAPPPAAPPITGASTGTSAPTVAQPGPADKIAPNATDAQVLQYLHKNYPDADAWLQNPELRKLIFDTTKFASEHGGVIDQHDWDTALKQTRYFQTHSPASRAFDQAIAKGDGTADKLVKDEKERLSSALTRQGVTLDDKALGDLAKTSIRGAWSDTDINKWLADRLRTTPAKLPGGASSAEADVIHRQAANYGIKMTDDAANLLALKLLDGTTTTQGIDQFLKDQAKTTWGYDPNVVRAIDQGIPPSSYFGAHTAAIANALELDPQQVDLLNDPKYSQVTRFYDPATKTQRAMTPTEAAQWARSQPEYRATNNYKQQDASIGLTLSRFLGAVA